MRFTAGKKNKSRWASIKIGLNAAVWNAPFTFISTMRPLVVGLTIALGVLVLSILIWFGTQLGILALGFMGLLTRSEDSQE